MLVRKHRLEKGTHDWGSERPSDDPVGSRVALVKDTNEMGFQQPAGMSFSE